MPILVPLIAVEFARFISTLPSAGSSCASDVIHEAIRKVLLVLTETIVVNSAMSVVIKLRAGF